MTVTQPDGPTEPMDAAGEDRTQPLDMPAPDASHDPGPPAPPFGVVEVGPPQGSAELTPGGHVTARFSAAVSEGSLSTHTFQLYRQGMDMPIPSGVRIERETMTATLIPSSPLEAGAAYTAVVRSGADGVRALSGEFLHADVAWNFTTRRPTPRWAIVAVIVAAVAVAAIVVGLLAARGGDGGASVSPEAIDFGDQALGARSASRDVQVTNDGSDPVVVESIGVTGANATDFVPAGARTCAPGAPIAVDASCAIGIAFAPTGEGDRAAELAIELDDGTTLQVALSGTGTGEAAAVASPARLAFGTVAVGGEPVSLQSTIRNTGTAALPIEAVTLSGAAADDFTLTGATTCAAKTSVAPGERCVVAVAFAPSQGGTRTAAVVVEYAGGSTQIELAGTGEERTEANLTPARADFPATAAGATSAATTFTFRNTGATEISLTAVALQGASPRSFEVAAGAGCVAGARVAAGGSCTVDVVFAPIAAGAVTATLSIVAAGEEWNAPLAGTGVAPATDTTGTTTAP